MQHNYKFNTESKMENSEKKSQYTLDCAYYKKSFGSIEELLSNASISGMDLNYEILKNGVPTGDIAIDLITF